MTPVEITRDIDGRETDFVVEEAGYPRMLEEAKLGDDEIVKGLRYLKARFPEAEAWRISLNGKKITYPRTASACVRP